MILTGKVIGTHGRRDPIERGTIFAFWVQHVAFVPTISNLRSNGRLDSVNLIHVRNGWEAQHTPVSFLQQMADQIILVQALHNDDDSTVTLII